MFFLVSDKCFVYVLVTTVAKFLKFAAFPWIALTPTDRHVLSSTDELVFSVFFNVFWVITVFHTATALQCSYCLTIILVKNLYLCHRLHF